MIIVALASAKGGVGKTASTIFLASEARKLLGDQRILVIDRDHSNFNLTNMWNWFPAPEGVVLATVAHLYPEKHIKIPESALRVEEDEVPGDFDLVFIDTPPGLGAVKSLRGAQLVVVPTKLEPQSIVGLDNYLHEVQVQRLASSPSLRLVAILPTMVKLSRKDRTAEALEIVERVARAHDLRVLARVRDLTGIVDWNFRNREYEHPAREVFHHVGYPIAPVPSTRDRGTSAPDPAG